MATVKIDTFHGISPRFHPSLLSDGMAVTAHNCRLKTGKLVPLRQPKMVQDIAILMERSYLDGQTVQLTEIANARSLHAWKKRDGSIEFLAFPGVTWMADGNLADDDRTRVVVSGETGADFTEKAWSGTEPKPDRAWHNAPAIYLRNPETGVKTTVPLPMNPLPQPLARRASSEPLDENKDVRYTRFFWTWFDSYGGTPWRESPVSEPSTIDNPSNNDFDLKYNDGDLVNLEPLTERGGSWPDGAAGIRVYKVVTGADDGRVQFVKEFSRDQCTEGGVPGAATLAFVVKDEDAGEVLTEMESAPGDLTCVQKVPGGFYAGFSPSAPKTVCFSDVNLMYSWPSAFRYDVDDNIVALAVTSNTVFVMTDGWPFVLSGTAPESMTVTKLAGPAACVSPRGVCVYKNALYYVGHQGLMTIYNSADAGTVCANLTDKVFTKEQWQAKNPASCVMGQYDGALFLFFERRDGSHEALTIDLTEQMDAVTTNDEVAKCVCTDNKTDRMYFVREEA